MPRDDNYIALTLHATPAQLADNLTDSNLRDLLSCFSLRKLLTALGPTRVHSLLEMHSYDCRKLAAKKDAPR